MDGKFTLKIRLVAGVYKTALPSSITYFSVVSRESVRLEFIISSLKDLDICACNIGNAYLSSPCRYKLWTEEGSEFGSEKGYVFLIVRALYGLKSSGADWISKLAETLNSMGYRSTESDLGVCIKRETIYNGTAYYNYMFVYVDDVLHLTKNAQEDMLKINQVYKPEEGFGSPDRFLSARKDKV